MVAQLRTDAATPLCRILELQYVDWVTARNVHGAVHGSTVGKDYLATNTLKRGERRTQRGTYVLFLVEGFDHDGHANATAAVRRRWVVG